MSRAPVQDGRALYTGTISAEDQQADIAGERPLTGRVPLTPAQQRALDEDRYPGDEAPPGYEAGTAVVSAELTGKPTRPPRDETRPDDAWERIDAGGDASAAKPGVRAAVEVHRRAQKLRDDFHRHAAKVKARAEGARGTDRERAATAEVMETLKVAARMKAKGIL